MYVRADRKIPASFQEIVREELNVKEFRYVEDASQFVSYTFKPQLKILGQKYGKKSEISARRWRRWTAVKPKRSWMRPAPSPFRREEKPSG